MDDREGTAPGKVIPLRRASRATDLDDDTLDALRDALEDLRREIRARIPELPAPPDDDDATFDVVGLVERLRGRLANLGIRERSVDIDEFGMDFELVERARTLLEWMREHYFRVEVQGIERLPARGPVLFVANRSGLLPYDGLMLAHVVEALVPALGRPRPMIADWLLTIPFVQPFLSRLGGVRACRENADRLLRTGRSVIAFPEGAKGATKTFRERYRLKRFGRGGVVRAAIESRVPLVPVGIVGAEEAHPVLFKSGLGSSLHGLPFLPVTPTFPWLGPLGLLPLPTKWVIVIGDPIDPPRPTDADDEELIVSRSTAALRERIQSLVETGLDSRESVWD